MAFNIQSDAIRRDPIRPDPTRPNPTRHNANYKLSNYESSLGRKYPIWSECVNYLAKYEFVISNSSTR